MGKRLDPTYGTTYRNLHHFGMKTTLNINDQLLADAKACAAQQRTTLTRLIEEGLMLRMRAQAAGESRPKLRLPVFKGRGDKHLGGNDIPDTWLVAATLHYGEHLVSFDRVFTRLVGRAQLTLLEPTST